MACSSYNHPEEIYWSNNFFVKKDHFRQVDSIIDVYNGENTTTLAFIVSGIYLKIVTYPRGIKKWSASAVMSPYKSQILKRISGENLAEILNHEQRHFDITEIVVRDLNKALKNIKEEQKADYLYELYKEKLKLMQTQYDYETEHYNNRKKQINWDNKIDSLLGRPKKEVVLKIDRQ